MFFLIDLVPQLDLTPIYAHYERETRGAPPFDVAMMTTLLVYAYCVGVFSSRKMAAACERNVAFLAIVGQQRPDFRSISDFRKIHLDALAGLFVEVLQIAGELGLVKLGNLALARLERAGQCFAAQGDELRLYDKGSRTAADLTAAANDQQQAAPLGQQTKENLAAAGIERPTAEDGSPAAIPLSADTGYFSAENVGQLESQGFDPYIATGRQQHNQGLPSGIADNDQPGPDATAKQRMSHTLRTESGRARYAKRKHIVAPVFGQIKQARGFRQFLLRGLPKVRGEWKLVCLTHNLLKIWRYRYALS